MKSVYFMKFVYLGLHVVGLMILGACNPQPSMKQESAFILLKTPTFKYADMGFIYKSQDRVKVEIYGVGQALMRLTISQEDICLTLLECMSKERFNREVLSRYYPKEMIEEVFRGKALFGGVNRQKNRNGFTQMVYKKHKYKIHYRVFNKEITFHDTINHIQIEIKR